MWIFFIFFFILISPTVIFSQGNPTFKQIPAIIHVHSTYSDNGILSLQKITEIARKKGIKGIIFTDHDIMKFEYGIPPFRNIIKKTIEKRSVLKYRPEKYISEINNISKIYPDMIIIPGVESSPFYFWSGNPFEKNLILNNWHKHILIAGLYKPEHYYKLPVIGNEIYAGERDISGFILPLLIICFSIIIMLQKLRFLKLIGFFMSIFGMLVLLNNYPFRIIAFNQYDGDKGDKPYQNIIDYVNRTAPETGMVFWAHPESPNFEDLVNIGTISIQTKKYPDSLYNTHNYTGFGYFQEGDEIVGSAGGIWDKILIDYCKNKRKFPVWTIGEVDYRNEGVNGNYINTVKNILLFEEDKKIDSNSVIKCFKSGRFYTIFNPFPQNYEIVLEKFFIVNDKNKASIGQSIKVYNRYKIIIKIKTTDNLKHSLNLKLIQDGKIINIFHTTTPVELENIYYLKSNQKTYCRLEIESENNCKLVTNPIFVF